MLSLFRKPKATIEVELGEGPIYPGGTLEANLTIEAKDKLLVQQGTVQLLCEDRFWQADISSSGGNANVKHSATLWDVPHSFLNDESIGEGSSNHLVSFVIPASASSSVHGEVASITWRVRVTLVVLKSRNVIHEKDFAVLTAPRSEDTAPSNENRSGEDFEQCSITLSANQHQVSTEGEITGKLEVQVHQGFSPSEIRVALERIERAGSSGKEVTSSKDILQGSSRLEGGGSSEWEYRLEVPDELVPTRAGSGPTTVRWRVRGIVARGRQGNLAVEIPVEVST